MKGIYCLLTLCVLSAIVTADDDLFLGEKGRPGLIGLDNGDDIFYWYYPSRTSPSDPLVLWFTGGPGCSSELALFSENGPYFVNEDGSGLIYNKWSWNNHTNLVFIDQPVGTGFSKCSAANHYSRTEAQVAANMNLFFTKWLNRFPEFKGRPLYLTGESYGGHYVPAISAFFAKQFNPDINLQGIAVGNGWVDPYVQYPEFSKFSLENDLVSPIQYGLMRAGFKFCQVLIKWKLWEFAYGVCNFIRNSVPNYGLKRGFNNYNIKLQGDYNQTNIDSFLNREDVKIQIGVPNRTWSECSGPVFQNLQYTDWMRDVKEDVRYLLDHGHKVLIYSGDLDYIVNWRGGEAWTKTIDWYGRVHFYAAPYKTLYVPNVGAVGRYKNHDLLTFLRVYQAGHMVPMDQPIHAYYMLEKFIFGEYIDLDPEV